VAPRTAHRIRLKRCLKILLILKTTTISIKIAAASSRLEWRAQAPPEMLMINLIAHLASIMCHQQKIRLILLQEQVRKIKKLNTTLILVTPRNPKDLPIITAAQIAPLSTVFQTMLVRQPRRALLIPQEFNIFRIYQRINRVNKWELTSLIPLHHLLTMWVEGSLLLETHLELIYILLNIMSSKLKPQRLTRKAMGQSIQFTLSSHLQKASRAQKEWQSKASLREL